ncbi:MAG: hypothetical protein COU08_02385 [Candidatus Harrisonbacteria bacterium CG10_big_fil_rev_8_21_14_0_10_42_17]|uniref:Uncharacterized protein n=1 Tax=Candidatus Harrisonbacteria bacterium CG10_big_fil_rev_8_21_14_0_10_42_17 TaxID=1974584 RepID=A0A2M6WI46_9BACT|nr:MAG: hypothetical protein COU08_02385 [Candidatus Harrisonbacteria bacterium CG10_big_fil_rev_8_21_14_0_10_42_17]
MTDQKPNKRYANISPERLAELRRATLIASTGASTRLEGSKLSDKEVAQVANIVFGRKQEHQRS